jgi:cell division protein ZapA
MSNQAVEVEILGKLTRVNCPPEHEKSLKLAARDLDARISTMAEKTKVANVEKLLTIAALNVCAELQQLKTESNELSEIEERIEKLYTQLDSALNQSSQGQQK